MSTNKINFRREIRKYLYEYSSFLEPGQFIPTFEINQNLALFTAFLSFCFVYAFFYFFL